jgi:hypothetical protein
MNWLVVLVLMLVAILFLIPMALIVWDWRDRRRG